MHTPPLSPKQSPPASPPTSPAQQQQQQQPQRQLESNESDSPEQRQEQRTEQASPPHQRPHPITIIEARPPPFPYHLPPPNPHHQPYPNPAGYYSYAPSPYYEHRWHPPPPGLTPAVFHHHRPDPDIDPRLQDMPHRVETDRNTSRRTDDRAQYEIGHSHPTPPPITTLHQSPPMAVAPLGHSISSPSPPGYYPHPPSGPHPYPYTPGPPLNGRYPGDGMPPPTMHTPYPTSAHVPPPGQANYVIYTDDAATKLSDRVRRKCYNCRTTDTSTWRRSSLTPGKVLCNKCGLFERTHSRPRPDQFPHKRGPMSTGSTFKASRTPPPGTPPAGRAQSAIGSPQQQQQQMQGLPPHHYDHPSIAPLINRQGGADAAQQQQNSNYSQPSSATPSANGTHSDVRSLLNSPPTASSSSSAAGTAQGSTSPSEPIVGQKRPVSPSAETPPSRSPRVEEHRSPQFAQRSSTA